MAVPTVAAVSSGKTASGGTAHTYTRAADGLSTIQEGDLLIFHFCAGGTADDLGLYCSVPSGWTHYFAEDGGSRPNAQLAYKFATDSEPATYTFTPWGSWSGTVSTISRIVVIRGARETDFPHAFNWGLETTPTDSYPSVSTTETDSLVLFFSSGAAANTSTVTMTNEQYDDSHDAGFAAGIAAGYSNAASAGSYAMSGYSTGWVELRMTLAIASPVVASSGLTSGTEAADQTSYATASITPTHRALVLASVLNTKASNADVPTITGCGLTWTRLRTITFGGSAGYRLTLFHAMSSTTPPTTGTLTIDFAGVAQTGCSWAVNEFTGVPTGQNGLNAIRNSAQNSSTSTGTDLTVTLPQIQSPNNVVFSAFGFIDNAAVTPGSGFTEIAEVQDTTPDRTLQTEFQQGRDRTADVTGPSVAAAGIAGIAIEIRATSNLTQAGLDSGSDASLKTSYTTNSITPSADSLILLAVYNSRSNQATEPTVTGCGLTWVLVSSSTFNVNGTQRLSIFRAMSDAPTPGALTIDFGGVGQLACQWSLAEFHNVNISGTNGENAIGRRGTAGGGQNSSTSLTVTLDSFADPENATYGAFAIDAETTPSAGSGLSTLHSLVDPSQDQALFTEYKLSEDTTVNASWLTQTFAAAFAAEIIAQGEVPDPVSSTTVMYGTPTIRVMQVTEHEDFRIYQTTDRKLASVDVMVVDEPEEADVRVRVVTDQKLADEFALVVSGEFDTSSGAVAVGYSDTYVDTYSLP